MSLSRYPKYKDSGVEWLGEVPEHWEVQPLFGVASERNESNLGMREDNLLSLSYGRIVLKDIESNDGLLPESFETYQIVDPGDMIFRLTDLQNDKRSLRTGIVEQRGIITAAYLAVSPINVQPQFFNHLLRAYDVTKVFYSMGGGLRQSMKFSDVKRLPILVPPTVEQTSIATFLKLETNKTDALVEEQRMLIELLKEKRQAVISHAVNKGLNPDAPMKDSGIEWLGEVPAHWDLKKFNQVSAIVRGASPRPAGDGRYFNGDFMPWITVGDLTRDVQMYLTSTESMLTKDGAELSRLIPEGTLVLSNSGATLGVPKILSLTGCANDGVLAFLSLDRGASKQFLYYYLTSLTENLRDRMKQGSGQPNLNTDIVKALPVPWPTREEQATIASHLDAETQKFDELTAEANYVIDLLQERRNALISAAVTGKIDVRGLATEDAA